MQELVVETDKDCPFDMQIVSKLNIKDMYRLFFVGSKKLYRQYDWFVKC